MCITQYYRKVKMYRMSDLVGSVVLRMRWKPRGGYMEGAGIFKYIHVEIHVQIVEL